MIKKEKKDDQVIICKFSKGDKKSKSDCVKKDDVAKELEKGGSLGECTQSSSSARIAQEVTSQSTDTEITAAATVQGKPTVVVTSINKFSVYPNPASVQVNLQLNNYTSAKAEVILMSQNGTIVRRKSVDLTAAYQKVVFLTDNLANGIYLVKVVSDEGIQIAKVIIQH